TAPPGGRASAEAGTAATARGAAKSAAGPSPAKTAAAKPPRAGGAPDGPDLVEVPGAAFAEIALTEIRPNPVQPRRVFDDDALAELTASVKEVGLLQPIVVRPLDPPQDGHSYELVMGERRWRAVAAAGLDSIPAIVRDTPDSQLLRDALLENLHRANLNPLEEAAAYQQMLDDFGCTQDQLAQQIARSRPQISNTLRLLKLPPLVQRRLAAGVLSAGHARALLGLPDGGAMERLAQRIVAEGLSVRATEEIVALGGVDAERPPARSRRRPVGSPAATALQDRLTDRFDTRVQVALGQRKGKVVIEFASVEDLNRILTTLAPGDPGLAV
ncbi:MAG: ParB/RepB/Spo0J family partition protein, partial [Bifidobacteriaceae bacterium]|nr:ParB/RepB/Spo0J family partition protein [Bifidobacteriaceae bacterium]